MIDEYVCTNPGRQVAEATKFCTVALMFVGPNYETCFMSTL